RLRRDHRRAAGAAAAHPRLPGRGRRALLVPLLDVQAVRHGVRRPRDLTAGVPALDRSLADLPRQRAPHPHVSADAERGGLPRARLRRRRLRPADRGRGHPEGGRADRPRSRGAAGGPAAARLRRRVPPRRAPGGADAEVETARLRGARARAGAIARRPGEWAERQHPGSRRGAAVNAWRRYEAVDGPLQSALLSLYVLVAVIPALLVMAEYLDSHPAALANHLTHHYGLSAPTAALVHSVLVQDRHHELGSALLAIAGALFFGLGFGRVLQIVHTRAWQIPEPS